MNQTVNDFGPFVPNFGPKNFFRWFYVYWMLGIVASYHRMEFQGKLMIQTQENGKKPHFGPDLGPLGPNLSHEVYFSKIWLGYGLNMVSYHHVQYQKKLMIQS